MSLTAHSHTHLDEANDLRERLAFLGLDPSAISSLKAIKPIVDREVPRALDKFYAHVVKAGRTQAFFSDPAAVQRAKAAQVQHWSRLSAGQFEGAAAQASRRMGQVHAELGVAPDVYISGYGQISGHLISAVVAEIWPKGALRGGAFARGTDAAAAISALMRVAMLDMEIGVAAYMEALDVKRRQTEAEAARVAQETQGAVGAVREALGQLAAKKLDVSLDDRLPGAFQQMAGDFNSAIGGLREAMEGVQTSLDNLNSSTSEIATASQELSSRTEHEASSIEQSSAALEEVFQQINKTAEQAQSAQSIVTQAGNEAQQSNEVVAQSIAAMERIERSSSDIGKIIGAIDEIAFQTNLLALNAGVEAARAGEAGRGFAVVASEVRGLAQRSAEAAKEIKALVATATSEVNGGVQLVSATGQALARIGAKVGEMSGVVSEILRSAQSQASSLSQIKVAVGELSSATQQNAAMAEESTAASQALARETASLSELVAQFKLGAGAPAPLRRPPASRPAAPAPRREAPAPRPRAASGGGSNDWKEF
jgi:methyl-accepting chemotaxis protein